MISDMRFAEAIPGIRDLYILDTEMLRLARYGSLYILRTPKPVIIETGFSHTLKKTLAALKELGIDPEEIAYIFPTHVHMDHAGGAGYLAQACINAQIVVHEVGVPHLIDPSKLRESVKRAVGPLFSYYGEITPIPAERILPVKGSEAFELGDGYSLEIIDAPGHAPHQYCLYERKHKALFTADAVGIYRRTASGFTLTTPPPQFHYEQWLATLQKFKALDLEWLCFTHFGAEREPYRLIDEYEEHLKEWFSSVERAKRELGDDQAVKVFFIERERKLLEAYYSELVLRSETEMNVQGVLLYLKRERGLA
jgi:glyoxylase-like metal-dependent hydrolase (beta-lactamase superfamily II)